VKRVALALALAAGAAGCGGGGSGELQVTQAALDPGEITLVVRNDSEETTRVAQVILNDAFVDFSASSRTVPPGDIEAIVVFYPWIRGESYDIDLMTSTGRTVNYEIEQAS
jgi:hypothetical protein